MTWNRDEPYAACVYVIQDGARVKVGSSWEPAVRHAKEIKRGVLVHETDYLPNGRLVEWEAHRILRKRGLAVSLEWFEASADEAKEAIAQAIMSADQAMPAPRRSRKVLTAADHLPVRVSSRTKGELLELRRAEPDLPGDSEMVRRLIRRAAELSRRERAKKGE